MKNFKLIMDTNSTSFQNDVTTHLQKGWKLHGSLQVTPTIFRKVNGKAKREVVFCQAVIKL